MSSKDERVAMYDAIIAGNSRELRNILKQSCSPDIILKESTRLCGLILATVHKKRDIVITLIRYRASLNLKDTHGMTAAMYACSNDNEEILSTLASAGADLTALDNQGRTALHHAAQAGSKNCLQSLLRHGIVDMNHVDVEDKSALMLAACRNNPHCLEFLTSHSGIDIDRVDQDGNSPLIAALHLRQKAQALILLDKGAKVNVKNHKGKTALSKVFEQTRNVEMIEMVEILLTHGAQPSFGSSDEFYLHEMIARGKPKVVQLMIVNGCTPRLRLCRENVFKFDINEKVSPLAVALLSNQFAIAKYLLANLFLTPFDVTKLLTSREISSHLGGTDYNHCSSVLKAMSEGPFPLFVLSLLAVSKLVFDKKGKKYEAESRQIILDQLPKCLQEKLQFKTQTASLCLREWASIPLMFVRGDTFQLTRPLNAVWPIGHKLIDCQFACCSKKTGYRLLRNDERDELE